MHSKIPLFIWVIIPILLILSSCLQQDPINQHYPDKAGITIMHLLTMLSGIDYSNEGIHNCYQRLYRMQQVCQQMSGLT